MPDRVKPWAHIKDYEITRFMHDPHAAMRSLDDARDRIEKLSGLLRGAVDNHYCLGECDWCRDALAALERELQCLYVFARARIEKLEAELEK